MPFYAVLAMPFTYRALDAGHPGHRPAHARRRVPEPRRGLGDDPVPRAHPEPESADHRLVVAHRHRGARRVHVRVAAAQGHAARRTWSNFSARSRRAASRSGCSSSSPRRCCSGSHVFARRRRGSDAGRLRSASRRCAGGADGDIDSRRTEDVRVDGRAGLARPRARGGRAGTPARAEPAAARRRRCASWPASRSRRRHGRGRRHRHLAHPPKKRGMGMVFQSYTLFPNMTGRATSSSGSGCAGVGRPTGTSGRRDARARAADGLRRPSTRTSSPAARSSGSRWPGRSPSQPRVLLLDEPLSALDAKVRESLRDEIRRMQTEFGITTLFVTHDQEEALGDRRPGRRDVERPARAARHPDRTSTALRLARSSPGSSAR